MKVKVGGKVILVSFQKNEGRWVLVGAIGSRERDREQNW